MKRRHRRLRSAVTNGTRLHIDVNGSKVSEAGRRFADILDAVEAERGGREAMSITAQEAARQYAALAVRAELMHGAVALGEAVDLEALGQIGDRMDRQARRMGPVKAPKALSIRDHIAARRASKGQS